MAVTIDELVVADEPGSWADAGFRVVDATTQVGSVRIRLTGRAVDDTASGIRSWSLRDAEGDLGSGEVDGLATTRSEREAHVASAHPNGVVRIDHLVVRTPDTRPNGRCPDRSGPRCSTCAAHRTCRHCVAAGVLPSGRGHPRAGRTRRARRRGQGRVLGTRPHGQRSRHHDRAAHRFHHGPDRRRAARQTHRDLASRSARHVRADPRS